MPTNDTIHIRGLDLPVHIGVPDEERDGLQVLSADIALTVSRPFEDAQDDLNRTVDYQAVANECRALAMERPHKLLETLASEIVFHLLGRGGVSGVEVELRKRILPGTDHVAVRMRRGEGV